MPECQDGHHAGRALLSAGFECIELVRCSRYLYSIPCWELNYSVEAAHGSCGERVEGTMGLRKG